MEETHPPEIPRKPPIYENLGPTYQHSLVSWAEFSSVEHLLAVGYEDGLVEASDFKSRCVHRDQSSAWFQVFELVDKDWVCLYTFRRTNGISAGGEAEEESSVSSILWHPIYAHDLLIGFSDGSAHAASFLDQSGTVSSSQQLLCFLTDKQ